MRGSCLVLGYIHALGSLLFVYPENSHLFGSRHLTCYLSCQFLWAAWSSSVAVFKSICWAFSRIAFFLHLYNILVSSTMLSLLEYIAILLSLDDTWIEESLVPSSPSPETSWAIFSMCDSRNLYNGGGTFLHDQGDCFSMKSFRSGPEWPAPSRAAALCDYTLVLGSLGLDAPKSTSDLLLIHRLQSAMITILIILLNALILERISWCIVISPRLRLKECITEDDMGPEPDAKPQYKM